MEPLIGDWTGDWAGDRTVYPPGKVASLVAQAGKGGCADGNGKRGGAVHVGADRSAPRSQNRCINAVAGADSSHTEKSATTSHITLQPWPGFLEARMYVTLRD